MNIRTKRLKKQTKIKSIVFSHIENNIKIYFINCLLIIIGIVLGVICMNHTSELQKEETSTYITSFIENVKTNNSLNELQIIKNSLEKNFFITVFVWIAGLTLIGSLFLYLLLLVLGFCLGYTISAIIYALGIGKGLLFILSTTFFQNLIFLPGIIIFTVCASKHTKILSDDKKNESTKILILKHTIVTIIFFCLFLVASIIESYVSKNLLSFFIKYL